MRRDLLVLALVALIGMAPSLIFGPGVIDSAPYNHIWTLQFGEALARGEVYPRWLPHSFDGLGSPTFYFYPPLAFYLAGSFCAAGLATGQAINAAALIVTWASGASMRFWLAGRSRRPLPWSCLYMVAPYHLADWYLRAALAEYSAFVWLPLIALALDSLRRPWGAPLLALAYAGLIMTHLPVALLASLGLILPLAVAVTLRADRRATLQMMAGLACGLALAAVYLAPALTLQANSSSALLWTPMFQPANWSIFDRGGPVPWGLRAWVVPIAAAIFVLGASVGLAAWRTGRSAAVIWGAIASVAAILALGAPPGLWTLPFLAKVQFPWRILAIAEFSALSAAAIAPPPRAALAVTAAIAASAYGRTLDQGVASLRDADAIRRIDATLPDAVEYLPAGFTAGGFDPRVRVADLRSLRGPLVSGPARLTGLDPDGRIGLRVDAPGAIVIRRFAFPAWRVTRQGREVATWASGPGRLLAFDATPGAYVVTLVALPPERLGSAISVGGLLGLAGLVLAGRRRRPG